MSLHESSAANIDGAQVWLPGQIVDEHIIINTGDELWMWSHINGSYIKISIKDGVPVTDGFVKQPPPEDKRVSKKWNADFN